MDPLLITQPDGKSWPWGWGAVMVETRDPSWVCEHCGKAPNKAKRKRDNFVGAHVYLFGSARCTPCATKWCQANWPAPRGISRRRI